jgi:hypothetical protein
MTDELEGRELAVAVATDVMKWYPKYFKDTTLGKLLKSDGKSRPWIDYNEAKYYYKDIDGKDTRMALIDKWRPDRDISAAWTVVEKTGLLDNYDLIKDGEFYVFGHYGEYGFDPWTEFVRAPTLPLAICLAALKAVEGNDE